MEACECAPIGPAGSYPALPARMHCMHECRQGPGARTTLAAEHHGGAGRNSPQRKRGLRRGMCTKAPSALPVSSLQGIRILNGVEVRTPCIQYRSLSASVGLASPSGHGRQVGHSHHVGLFEVRKGPSAAACSKHNGEGGERKTRGGSGFGVRGVSAGG
jgi:hypothetical protein